MSIENKSDLVFEPSTIENVDLAMYIWLNEKMDLYTNTNKGWNKVPVVWVSGERSFQIKNRKEARDSSNNFILPVMTLERTEMSKDLAKKGKYWGDVIPNRDEKGGSIAIQTTIKQDKTSNFANSASQRVVGQPNFRRKNKKIVYQTKFVPMPVYVTMTYIIDIKTEYQQQMNDLLQPFMTKTGAVNYFIIENEGHRYESFIDSKFSTKNNGTDLQQSERIFNSQVTINVLAHLVGEGSNIEKPKVALRENIVEVKIPREYIIFDEENDKMKKY